MALRLRHWAKRITRLSAGVALCASLGCMSSKEERKAPNPAPLVKTGPMGGGNMVSNGPTIPAYQNLTNNPNPGVINNPQQPGYSPTAGYPQQPGYSPTANYPQPPQYSNSAMQGGAPVIQPSAPMMPNNMQQQTNGRPTPGFTPPPTQVNWGANQASFGSPNAPSAPQANVRPSYQIQQPNVPMYDPGQNQQMIMPQQSAIPQNLAVMPNPPQPPSMPNMGIPQPGMSMQMPQFSSPGIPQPTPPNALPSNVTSPQGAYHVPQPMTQPMPTGQSMQGISVPHDLMQQPGNPYPQGFSPQSPGGMQSIPPQSSAPLGLPNSVTRAPAVDPRTAELIQMSQTLPGVPTSTSGTSARVVAQSISPVSERP